MLVSELIEHLEKLKEQAGDVPVEVNDEVGTLTEFTEQSVYTYNYNGGSHTRIIFDV
jgi:hypothetical protein